MTWKQSKTTLLQVIHKCLSQNKNMVGFFCIKKIKPSLRWGLWVLFLQHQRKRRKKRLWASQEFFCSGGVFTQPHVAAFQCNKLQQLQSQLNSDHYLSVLSGVLTCIFCCQSSYKNFLKPVLLRGSPVEWFRGCALWQGGAHVHTPSEINDKRQTVLWKCFFEVSPQQRREEWKSCHCTCGQPMAGQIYLRSIKI